MLSNWPVFDRNRKSVCAVGQIARPHGGFTQVDYTTNYCYSLDMSIINELSSQAGDKTEASNRRVAEKCINNSMLIQEIAEGLGDKNQKLAADCAEVLTFISEQHPGLVVPHTDAIIAGLDHKHTKVRWEATHTIAYIAAAVPDSITSILEVLQRMALSDKSKIVQDYATIAIGNYGSSGAAAASKALPLLTRVLEIEGDRQAVRVLEGMGKLLRAQPSLKEEISQAIASQSENPKSSIVKAYKKLAKALDS